MPEDIGAKLDQVAADLTAQRQRLDAIYVSTEKTRKYFLWTLIVTVVLLVLPLIGLAFAIPFYLQTLSGLSL